MLQTTQCIATNYVVIYFRFYAAHSEAEDRHDRTPKTSNKFKTSNEQPKASSHQSPKGIRDGKQHSPQKEKTVRIGQQRLNSRILQSQDNVCAHCRSPCCAKFSEHTELYFWNISIIFYNGYIIKLSMLTL